MTLERMRSTSTFEVGDAAIEHLHMKRLNLLARLPMDNLLQYETGGNDDFSKS